MSSVWLEGPSINAVPYRLFVTKGRPKVVAAILFADDKQFYLAFDREVKNVAKELLLPLPHIDRANPRDLVFRFRKRKVKATGYPIRTGSKYEFDLVCEAVRAIIMATLDRPVRVIKLMSDEMTPQTTRSLTDEEKAIYELVPPDNPSELEEELKKLEQEAQEKEESEGQS